MLATRVALAGVLGRTDEDEPLLDVVLALSAAVGAMIAIFDAVSGLMPLTAIPCLVVLAGHVVRARRIALLAAVAVWLRLFGMGEATGLLVPTTMIGACVALYVGPDRALEWLERHWAAHAARSRHAHQALLAAEAGGEHVGATGWIEDLPDR